MRGPLSSEHLVAFGSACALHVIGLALITSAVSFSAPAPSEPLVADLLLEPPSPPRVEPPRPIIPPEPPRAAPPRPRIQPPKPIAPPSPRVEPPPPTPPPVAQAPVPPSAAPPPPPATPPPATPPPAAPPPPVAPAPSPAPAAPAAPAGLRVSVPRADAVPSTGAPLAGGVSMTQNPPAGPAAPPAPPASSRPAPGAVAALPPGPQSLREAVGSGRLGVVSNPGPRYPESARRRGVQGTTLLKVHVLDDGRMGEIEVAESAGDASLDRAALEAVRRWRFEPGKDNGTPVALWVLIPFEFRLR